MARFLLPPRTGRPMGHMEFLYCLLGHDIPFEEAELEPGLLLLDCQMSRYHGLFSLGPAACRLLKYDKGRIVAPDIQVVGHLLLLKLK